MSSLSSSAGLPFTSISEAIAAFRKSPHVLYAAADYTGVLYNECGETFHSVLHVLNVDTASEPGVTQFTSRLSLTPDELTSKDKYLPNDGPKPPTIVYHVNGRIQSVIDRLTSTAITRADEKERLLAFEDETLIIDKGRVRLSPMGASQLITMTICPIDRHLPNLQGTLQLPAVSLVKIDRLPIGCPILSHPVTNLLVVCTYLNKQELFSMYRSCKPLAAVASNPMIFKMQSRIVSVNDARMGVKLVGPTASYSDALLLNAALQNSILANLRHLQLAPVLSNCQNSLVMLELLGASSQTSLLSLKIRSHVTDWASIPKNDAPPSLFTAENYPLRAAKFSPEKLHADFIAGRLQPTLKISAHPHPFGNVNSVAFPGSACAYCLQRAELVHRCSKCPNHLICNRCLVMNGGFKFPEAYLHRDKGNKALVLDFFNSKSVAFLKYLLLDVPNSAALYLTHCLPPNLETLHFNCSSVDRPIGDANGRWSVLQRDLIKHITRVPTIKHLIFGNQPSDLSSVTNSDLLDFPLISGKGEATEMEFEDLLFLSNLSEVPQLETFRLPFLMQPCNVGKPLPIIRKVNKVYMSYHELRNNFAFLDCFPDLNSLFIQDYVVRKNRLEMPDTIAMKLTELALGTNSVIDQAWLNQLAMIKFPHLTSLTIARKTPEAEHGTPYSFKELFRSSMPNLVQVTLRNFTMQQDLFEDFRQLKNLLHLNNFYWNQPTSQLQQTITTLHDVFPSLVSLHVNGCSDKTKRTAQWMEPLLRTIPNLQSIKWLNEKRVSPAQLSAHYAEQAARANERAQALAELVAKENEEKAAMALRAVHNTQKALERYGDTDQLSENNRNWYKGDSKAKSEDPDAIARRLHKQYEEEQQRMAAAIAASKAATPFSFTPLSSAAFSPDAPSASVSSPSLFNVGGASSSTSAGAFSKSSGARDKKKTPKRVSIAASGSEVASPSTDGNQSFPPPAFSSPFTAGAFNAAPVTGTPTFGVASEPTNPFASSAAPFQFSAASPSFAAPVFSSAAPVFGNSSSSSSTSESTSFPSFMAVNQALDDAANTKK